MYTFLYIIFIDALNDKLRTIGSTLGEKKKKEKTRKKNYTKGDRRETGRAQFQMHLDEIKSTIDHHCRYISGKAHQQSLIN